MQLRTVLCWFLLLGPSLAAGATIFGPWQLDVENSDDVTAILSEAASKSHKKSALEWKKDPDGPAQWQTPLPLMQAKKLLLKMQGAQLAIRPDIGKPVVFVPNQGAASVSLSGWGSRKQDPVRFGTWEGDTLIVESSLDEGTRVIQSYYVDADGLLVQETEVKRSIGDPVIIKRKFRSTRRSKNDASH